jgi:hypothetical protein
MKCGLDNKDIFWLVVTWLAVCYCTYIVVQAFK